MKYDKQFKPHNFVFEKKTLKSINNYNCYYIQNKLFPLFLIFKIKMINIIRTNLTFCGSARRSG